MQVNRIIGLVGDFAMRQIILQKDQLFLWLPILLSIGIGVYFSFDFEPPLFLGIMSVLICISCAALIKPVRDKSVLYYGVWLLILASIFASAGFTVSQLQTARVYTPMLQKKLGPVELTGRIHAVEALEENKGARLLIGDLEIEKLTTENTPRFVRLKLRTPEGIEVGQKISALALLNPPSAPIAPGAFDFQRYAYFRGIGAVGFIFNPPEILEERSAEGLGQHIEYWRQSIAARIQAALEPREGGVAMALMVGRKSAIKSEDVQAMRDAGLAHMLAISGLHVGLFSGLVFFFVRFVMALFPTFTLNHPIKKYSAAIALIAAVFYMLLAGATIPTQRAVLMTGFVLVAVMFDRLAISLRLVAIAAMAVLILSPESLMSASFQMSFAAVCGLVAFYDGLRPFLARLYAGAGFVRRAALYFLGVTTTTVIASVATGIFALYHFQKLALFSVISNFLAMPVLAFLIMPFAVIALILMPFELEGPALSLVSIGVDTMLDIAHWTAQMEGAVWHAAAWPSSALLCFTIAGLWLILWRGPLKWAFVVLAITGFLMASNHTLPNILISAEGKLVGVHSKDRGLFVSSGRADRFTRENWERLYGLEEGSANTWPKEGNINIGSDQYMVCGEQGCRLSLEGRSIALTRSSYAHESECAWANIIITPEPLKPWTCNASTVIDRFAIWREGAHGLSITEDSVYLRTDIQTRGSRPWVIARKRSKKKSNK